MSAPEFAEAERQLAAIPPEVLADNLRHAVLRAAQTSVLHREAQLAVSDGESAVQAAIQAQELQGAMAAASELQAARLVVELLPPAVLDAAAVAEACDRAVAMVQAARQHAGAALPPLAYSLEMAAFRSLPHPVMVQWPPVLTTPHDVAVTSAASEFEASRAAALRTADGWLAARAKSEPLGWLAAAGTLAEQLTETGAAAAGITATIEDANRQRADAGLTWEAPNGIESLATRQLARHRRGPVVPAPNPEPIPANGNGRRTRNLDGSWPV